MQSIELESDVNSAILSGGILQHVGGVPLSSSDEPPAADEPPLSSPDELPESVDAPPLSSSDEPPAADDEPPLSSSDEPPVSVDAPVVSVVSVDLEGFPEFLVVFPVDLEGFPEFLVVFPVGLEGFPEFLVVFPVDLDADFFLDPFLVFFCVLLFDEPEALTGASWLIYKNPIMILMLSRRVRKLLFFIFLFLILSFNSVDSRRRCSSKS